MTTNSRYGVLRYSVTVMIALLTGQLANAQPNVDLFEDFSTSGLPGRLMIPPEAATSERPVVLFLHGAGETGTNNTSQVNGNINNLISAAQDRGAFIYAPQATSFGWTSPIRTDLVVSMIDQLLLEYNADPNRIYITGLSMGGGGSWAMSSRYSERFAANVPIAGVGPGTGFQPANLLDLPTWAFHARNDPVVSVGVSRNVIQEILTAGGEPTLTFPSLADPDFEFVSDIFDLRYTEPRSGGHGIWGAVYAHEPMYDWMFAKSVPEPGNIALIGLVTIVGSIMGRRGAEKGGGRKSNQK